MPTILVGIDPDRMTEEHLARIREAAPGYDVLFTQNEDEVEAALEDIEIVVGDFPRDWFGRATNLRWMQQWGAGADWLMRHPEAAEMDFVLTNASGVHAIPITEHIFAFLFGLARNFQGAIRDQVAHRWRKSNMHDLFELPGKTMLIVGVGAIGEQTARVAAALDMTVIGVRRDPSVPADGVTRMIGTDHLLDVLPKADFVVVTVPLTRETAGMFGEREFRAMKSSSYFINIGRGKTVDQAVLVRALEEGWIAGAGLDVVDPEPLPADSPLWDMPNVILTSHYSGLTPHYDDRALAIFLDNLRRYQAGEAMRNVVDKKVGY